MPDINEINAMKNLLNIMNGGTPAPQPKQVVNGKVQSGPISIEKLTDPDVQGMKKILEGFYSAASNTAETLRKESSYDREVSEALQTERTENGSRVGSWQINVNVHDRSGKDFKTYDVISTYNEEPIAKDLYLYEVAHGLVMLLNRGETITGRAIREMLNLEEQYTRNRLDAIRFKKRYNESLRNNDRSTAEIMESRYSQAKTQALQAKNNINNLYEKL